MSEKRIVKVKTGERKRGRTDFARLARLTDEEIEAAAEADLENPPAAAEWLKSARLVERPPKEAISIRVDADVLAWFRAQGSGYQSMMNAVLRAYAVHERMTTASQGHLPPGTHRSASAPGAPRPKSARRGGR